MLKICKITKNKHTFDDAPRAVHGLFPSGADQPSLDLVDERLHRGRVLSQQLVEFRELARPKEHLRHPELVVHRVETECAEQALKVRKLILIIKKNLG